MEENVVYDYTPLTILDRPKQLAEQTTVALYTPPLQAAQVRHKGVVLTNNLGSRVVTITCRMQDPNPSVELKHVNFPHTYTVHETLLCAYSRYFNELLGRPFEKQMLSEIFEDISRNENAHLTANENAYLAMNENPHLSAKVAQIPPGYVPSWITGVCADDSPQKEDEVLEEQVTSERKTCSIDEDAQLFGILVHWLYTQELLALNVQPERNKETYANLYAMSERLDVPGLRQACYDELCIIHEDFCVLPSREIAAIILSQCSRKSRLRRSVVDAVAYMMLAVEPGKKDAPNLLLDLNSEFAADVAEKTLSLLRSDTTPLNPCKDARYQEDDSDSDFVPESDSEDLEETNDDMSESDSISASDPEFELEPENKGEALSTIMESAEETDGHGSDLDSNQPTMSDAEEEKSQSENESFHLCATDLLIMSQLDVSNVHE